MSESEEKLLFALNSARLEFDKLVDLGGASVEDWETFRIGFIAGVMYEEGNFTGLMRSLQKLEANKPKTTEARLVS